MAIVGIAELAYGVEDLALSTRYFEDFGLPVEEKLADRTTFRLASGSAVLLRRISDPLLPKACFAGSGVRETIFAVDTPEALERLARNLRGDRALRRDDDGSVHFLGPEGHALGLRVQQRKPVICIPDPINAPDHIARLNLARKWRVRARPKTIDHLGLYCDDYVAALEFFVERLGFRYTDHSCGLAAFARADGCYEHHTVFLLNSAAFHRSGPGFHHTSFGVEDLDEVMTGANYMARQGWPASEGGLGRHRISSALFWYQQSPAGGEAEYHTDCDCVDDDWVPRAFEPTFGYTTWISNLLPFQMKHPEWAMQFDPKGESLQRYRHATQTALHASMAS